MHLYTVKAEQTIFHTVSLLAKSENDAINYVNEMIQDKKIFSTSQQIKIKNITEDN